MFIFGLSATIAVSCQATTLEQAAQGVVHALQTRNYECLRQNIEDPDFKFPNGVLSPAVDFSFRAENKRSYYDIARNGVYLNIQRNGNLAFVNFIDAHKESDFKSDKKAFLDTEFMKSYFNCQFILKGGKWLLTKDLCFTETGY